MLAAVGSSLVEEATVKKISVRKVGSVRLTTACVPGYGIAAA